MSYKLMAITLTALAVTSCGSNYKRPESIEAKMARFEDRRPYTNQVPLFQVQKYESHAMRGPASATSSKTGEASKFTNKRLYFLSLYEQYTQLSRFSDKRSAPNINICPNFHTSLSDFKERNVQANFPVTLTGNYSNFNEEYMVTHTPELLLPMTSDSQTPRVVDILKSQNNSESAKSLIDKAMGIHLAKTYSELVELCESGSSSNYYIYENLLTESKRKNILTKDENGLNILLKTTVFSNMALIKSLNTKVEKQAGRGIASTPEKSIVNDELFKRLNVNWSKDFFDK
ncbi:putative lipoprotein [Bacteriovorax sp. BSW11_IV]|uniref:hypothetical protein n=1 Tax=Bacteriovorax sp. BSW11_IV TaxID=1353529 RepID=UPI00038A239F|nr:hypothetical protein [Bacteriovorax sp. BSW11_IV]EQC48985.1 putative lipoprotein [Bacteriovorax sp. BSW11_IV]